jgi:hypothetical protein
VGTTAQLKSWLAEESELWGRVARESGIRAE